MYYFCRHIWGVEGNEIRILLQGWWRAPEHQSGGANCEGHLYVIGRGVGCEVRGTWA